jgi:hypothetical protein
VVLDIFYCVLLALNTYQFYFAAFDLTFPEGASANEKALLMGSAMFFNSNFFEGANDA